MTVVAGAVGVPDVHGITGCRSNQSHTVHCGMPVEHLKSLLGCRKAIVPLLDLLPIRTALKQRPIVLISFQHRDILKLERTLTGPPTLYRV